MTLNQLIHELEKLKSLDSRLGEARGRTEGTEYMSTDEVKKAIIERCARFAHEANRLWCLLLGDESQTTWEHDRLPPEQKAKDHIFHFAVKVELLANPEKLESPDQSKGMEALVAKMLPVIKNELYDRGNAATCLPEDRQVAWALMKGLQAISDVLNVPKALMRNRAQ